MLDRGTLLRRISVAGEVSEVLSVLLSYRRVEIINPKKSGLIPDYQKLFTNFCLCFMATVHSKRRKIDMNVSMNSEISFWLVGAVRGFLGQASN
jgi:hypothetical protein